LKVTVNGKAVEVQEQINLWDFVMTYRTEAEGIIAELNQRVVKRDIWMETVLTDGDKLELVSLVGGG
jgi:sulfur carrier protein